VRYVTSFNKDMMMIMMIMMMTRMIELPTVENISLIIYVD